MFRTEIWFDELAKNLQILKVCEGNALEGKCIPSNLRGGEVVYAETQGGEDKQAAIDEFNKGCSIHNTNYIQNRNHVYMLNSGVYIISPPHNYKGGSSPVFIMDVNGFKGPNKWGHDVFLFCFYKNKVFDSVFGVIPHIGCHPLDNGGYYTKTFFQYLYGQNAEL